MFLLDHASQENHPVFHCYPGPWKVKDVDTAVDIADKATEQFNDFCKKSNLK